MRFDDCLDKTELRARAAEAVAAAAKAKASYQPESAAPSTAASMESSGSSGSMEQPGSASATMLLESVSGLSLKDLKALIQESGLSSDGCIAWSEQSSVTLCAQLGFVFRPFDEGHVGHTYSYNRRVTEAEYQALCGQPEQRGRARDSRAGGAMRADTCVAFCSRDCISCRRLRFCSGQEQRERRGAREGLSIRGGRPCAPRRTVR